jgi:hypothetical protein
MISKLSEVLDNYSVTDNSHGTVKFGPKEAKTSVKQVAYLMLAAAGDAMSGITDPHITIWGANGNSDSKIASVEFSWAGARHVYFNPKKKSFSIPNIPSKDMATASKLELLLKLFLNASTIPSITVTTSPTSTPLSSPKSNSNALANLSSATEWPAL